jgi:phosphoribosylformylglycinamidine synthase PurS subunit
VLHIIGHMLFGLVIGVVAKLLIPGNHPGGLIATMILGLIGAWLGGLLGRTLGMYPPGHPAGFLMALVGAVIVLVAYGFLTRPAATSARVDQHTLYSECRYNPGLMKARVFVSLKSTVLDPQGQTVRSALNGLGHTTILDVRQGKMFEVEYDREADLEAIARDVLTNPVIEDYRIEYLEP